MASTIYFDESGNTGQDMLNQDQKVFVLASVNYLVEHQQKIKEFFGVDGEIHFKSLKKSGAGRRKILSFLNSKWIHEQYVILYYVNKEFATCGQIVDLLAEIVLHHKGYDIYINGRHIAFTNHLFYFGNFFWNKQLFKKFLESFVEMVRTKDATAIKNFYILVEELYSQIEEKEILKPIKESKRHIDEIIEAIDRFTIDVTFSTFLVLCDKWSKRLGKKIDVRFDRSKQLEHYNLYIEKTLELSNTTKKKIEIGYDNRTMTFPHQINSVELVNSVNEFGVQCADLIASSLAFAYNNEEGRFEKFSKQIKDSRLFELSNAQSIWPTDDVSPEALGMSQGKGINPLDFLATNFPQGFR
ncbi:DUF3800 domain-containing protein [Muricauda sp. JGD-17]|uniref:DUF3800 domain-containing protein n=1 Tax=Flagellimonas ochracea TaxID=2696472 RepID=A0A964T9W7_9FLAO|nr:DUF3800 domain-containing protein [Allomuricauda ochracea]NAY90935.1 DUF3800 domain-containing protein [Allomuricauda ochracea]